MSSTGVEANPMSVGNNNPHRSESPASNSSGSRKHHKRISPEASVSLRHGQLSTAAAEPGKAFAIPATLRHGDPNSNSHREFTSSKRKRPVQFQVPEEGLNDDKESAFNSNTSGSNDRSIPEDWFKNWNTNVGDFNHAHAADGDSPYYLPSERQLRKQKQRANQPTLNARDSRTVAVNIGLPASTNLARSTTQSFNPSFPSMIPTQDSEDESDVYRSVIDDLTVKNKKLKKKLRKMERLHCNELSEEKLFEVRCYGLPPARKQELQELLQKFAADLEGGGNGVYEAKRSDAISNANATSSTNPSSSSLLQNTDSAYATETRMTSLDGASVDVLKVKSVAGQPLERMRATQSANPEMRPLQFANERAKMKIVVRRLEQLFTGSDALLSELEKAKAQQVLAEEAAYEKHDILSGNMADSGDEDDRREAAIMTAGNQEEEQKSSHPAQSQSNSLENQNYQSHQSAPVGQRRSLDMSHQRPTRPMDLDPNRAQVAAENVEYLEHLSLSSSRKALHFKPAAVGETTGWVYLNLINNLAQIHTLNVSQSFIKKAIGQMSDKLELSPDGNKVRWRGGLTGTRLSSDGDTSSCVDNSSNGESSPGEGNKSGDNNTPPLQTQKPMKRTSTKARSRVSTPRSRETSNDKFRYRPLMFHTLPTQKSTSEETSEQDSSGSESESDANNSGGPPPILDHGTNIEISDIGKFAPLDGAIIYFGGAPFCTDLSAQVVFREGGHSFTKNGDTRFYDKVVDKPIGPEQPFNDEEDDSEETKINSKPLNNFDWSALDTEMEMEMVEDLEERLPQLTSIMSTSTDILPSVMPSPYSFPASGLSGVRPEDNFVVYVKTTQKPTVSRHPRAIKHHKIHHSIPFESLKAFTESEEEHDGGVGFQTDTLDALHIRLTPSKLPDPVFAVSLSEGSSDPFATNSDEPRSYESHLSFAYNIEEDSRSSGEGVPSFHSPEISDESPMDLDALEGIAVDENPLAPLSVVATAGTLSQDGSVAAPSPKMEIPLSRSVNNMDISTIDLLS